jgi:glycosyltransferase involved in cell wall biosynthesis
MKAGKPMKPRPDLSIIIVNWNTRALLADCLASIAASNTACQLEIFVVDNASNDGSPEMVAAEFPQVRLIRNTRNRGFAAANNQAIGLAGGRHVLLLNSDTIVHPGVLDASAAYMDANPEVGIMGCRVLNADGSVQISCGRFPTLTNLLLLTSGLFKVRGFAAAQRYRMDGWQRDCERDVDVISGCYLLARADAIRTVGMLDESFFFFGELLLRRGNRLVPALSGFGIHSTLCAGRHDHPFRRRQQQTVELPPRPDVERSDRQAASQAWRVPCSRCCLDNPVLLQRIPFRLLAGQGPVGS